MLKKFPVNDTLDRCCTADALHVGTSAIDTQYGRCACDAYLAVHLLQEPQARLATVAAAGAERVPFTTGLLIGIGETRGERLDTLFAIRDLHAAHGHIQVQDHSFAVHLRPGPGSILPTSPVPLRHVLYLVSRGQPPTYGFAWS